MTIKLSKETLYRLNEEETSLVFVGAKTDGCPQGDLCKGCNTKEGPCCSACRCDPSKVIGCQPDNL